MGCTHSRHPKEIKGDKGSYGPWTVYIFINNLLLIDVIKFFRPNNLVGMRERRGKTLVVNVNVLWALILIILVSTILHFRSLWPELPSNWNWGFDSSVPYIPGPCTTEQRFDALQISGAKDPLTHTKTKYSLMVLKKVSPKMTKCKGTYLPSSEDQQGVGTVVKTDTNIKIGKNNGPVKTSLSTSS